MSLSNWWRHKFAKSTSPLERYKSGITKARKHDHQGAIAEYTAAIDTPGATSVLRAMALFNRALVHAAVKDNSKAIDDLNIVLRMDEPLVEIKKAARQKLDKIRRRSGKTAEDP